MRIREVSPRTVNIKVKFLNGVFNKAIVWGKTVKNPIDEVSLFKEKTKGDERQLDFVKWLLGTMDLWSCSPRMAMATCSTDRVAKNETDEHYYEYE